jgi:hypothetical protein
MGVLEGRRARRSFSLASTLDPAEVIFLFRNFDVQIGVFRPELQNLLVF